MSEHTPTTEEVREDWSWDTHRDPEVGRVSFDRWLAAELRRAKAEAWEEGYAGGYDFRASHGIEGAVANPYKEDTNE